MKIGFGYTHRAAATTLALAGSSFWLAPSTCEMKCFDSRAGR